MLKTGKVFGAELQEGLDTIERNARMQTQLISDLLDMSRIITGKTRLDVRPVDLVDVIQQAAATVRPAMEARQIRMSLILDPKAAGVRGECAADGPAQPCGPNASGCQQTLADLEDTTDRDRYMGRSTLGRCSLAKRPQERQSFPRSSAPCGSWKPEVG